LISNDFKVDFFCGDFDKIEFEMMNLEEFYLGLLISRFSGDVMSLGITSSIHSYPKKFAETPFRPLLIPKKSIMKKLIKLIVDHITKKIT
jgi:hypothetical protein